MAFQAIRRSRVQLSPEALKYSQLATTYNLPSFEALDALFEIKTEEEVNLLRHIRRKITEKFEVVASTLQDILNPDATPAAMFESGVFSDEQKDKILILFREFMYVIRSSAVLNIDDDDVKNAEFIKSAYSFWQEKSSAIVHIFTSLRDSWKKGLNKSKRAHYLG